MTLDVTVRAFPPSPFAYLRHVGPYQEVGPVFRRACAIAGEKRLFGPDTKVMMRSYDDPMVTDETRLRSDAGVTLSGAAADPAADLGELTRGAIAGGMYAVALYKGPYEGLSGCFDWLLCSWLPSSGYEADDRPCVEVYRNDPSTIAPAELLTEIRVPVVAA